MSLDGGCSPSPPRFVSPGSGSGRLRAGGHAPSRRTGEVALVLPGSARRGVAIWCGPLLSSPPARGVPSRQRLARAGAPFRRTETGWMAPTSTRWGGSAVEPPRHRSQPGLCRLGGLDPRAARLCSGRRAARGLAGQHHHFRAAADPLGAGSATGRGLHDSPGGLRCPGRGRHRLASPSLSGEAGQASGSACRFSACSAARALHHQPGGGTYVGGSSGRGGGSRREAGPALRRGPGSRVVC